MRPWLFLFFLEWVACRYLEGMEGRTEAEKGLGRNLGGPREVVPHDPGLSSVTILRLS